MPARNKQTGLTNAEVATLYAMALYFRHMDVGVGRFPCLSTLEVSNRLISNQNRAFTLKILHSLREKGLVRCYVKVRGIMWCIEPSVIADIEISMNNISPMLISKDDDAWRP